PSHAARMLAGSRIDTIGVVLPLLDDGFYVQVLRGIDQVTTQENLKLLISFYHSDVDLAETLSTLGREGRTGALIVSNHTSLQPDKMRELAGDDLPIVLIAQKHGNIKAIDSVLIDNFQGAYQAVEHLLEQKPKSLLLFSGPDSICDSRERLAGAQQAIEDAPFKPEVTILQGNFYQEEGRRGFAEYVSKQGTFPDAVFALNDATAFGVLDVLRDASRQVPEETQVVGFDGTIMAQSFGLSSVSVPMRKIGEEAVRLATERIRDKDAKPVSVTLETQLVVRKTTLKES
ncbi:MAG TPA: substrate-binding domain-containing protein, partial [Pontiella sp.]|nr:substrate-binding domain-containing protein [Pontiella sp.]